MSQINDNQIPSMELPNVTPDMNQAISEQVGVTPVSEASASIAVEQGVSQSQPPTSASQPFDMNLGPQPAVATTFDPPQDPSQAVSPLQGTMPAIADDNDLIEKEWVEKAKQIVEHTKSDPRKQNIEMNKVKAEYLKKRYNKEVKLVEE